MTALYICYFNTEEPLVHNQVLPYLRAVANTGMAIHLLTYERARWWRQGERERRRALRAALRAQGIEWHTLAYHKRPSLLATLYDIAIGFVLSLYLVTRFRVRIVHARSHVPGVIALALKRVARTRLLFDFRGLMAEEYVDNGVWREGSVPFRLVKAVERALVRAADHVVVLTEKLKGQLAGEPYAVPTERVSVIPCCVDLSRYPVLTVTNRQSPDRPLTLVYVGSTTGRYLLGEMAAFFCVLRSKVPMARFLVVTQSNHGDAERALESSGIRKPDYRVVRVAPEGVADLIGGADVGISFITPTAALDGASPTKIPEYLAAGLAVVSSAGVGDTDTIVANGQVGTLVREFAPNAYEAAADAVLDLVRDPATRTRCRETAERYYSLQEVGEPRYRAVYRSLDAASGLLVP